MSVDHKNSVELLKWMKNASAKEIYEEALRCEDDNAAITMCEHAALAVKFRDPLSARVRMHLGKLYVNVGHKDAVHKLKQGMEEAKYCNLKETDEQLVEVKCLYNQVRTPDPNSDLINEYYEHIDDYRKKLLKKMSHSEMMNEIYKLPQGWKTLLLCLDFDTRVRWDGLTEFFETAEKAEFEEIIAAFKTLDEKISNTVKKACELYKRVGLSSASNDEAYCEAEDDYTDSSESLKQLLANLIRTNPELFPKLK